MPITIAGSDVSKTKTTTIKHDSQISALQNQRELPGSLTSEQTGHYINVG